MWNGFAGWHILIALGVFLTFAIIVAAVIVIVIVIVVSRRDGPVVAQSGAAPGHGAQVHAPQPVSARLAELERLRASGQVSETEYSAKRAEILGDL